MAARKTFRLLLKGGLWLVGFATLALVLGAGVFLWMVLPQTRGEVEIEGLQAPVEVLRDGDDVITIRAGSELPR